MFKPFAPLCLALLAGSALAQAPVANNPAPGLEQRTERLVHMDSGSRIEELRVGGETRRIDVETRSAVPGYQVNPITSNQSPDSGLGQRSGTAGRSSWRLLNF